MPKTLGYWDYVRAAFHARPEIRGLGRVPLNKLGVTAVGLLGGAALLVAPPVGGALWLLGGAAELGYLYSLSSNPRFQAHIRRVEAEGEQQSVEQRREGLLEQLSPAARDKYRALAAECHGLQSQADPSGALGGSLNSLQFAGLDQLLWIYLKLLATGETLVTYLSSGAHKKILHELKVLEEELKDESLEDRVRKSKQSTLDILRRRYERLKAAARQVKFIDSELQRIKQQVTLLKEEALLNRDPTYLTDRIDAVTETLAETNEWMRSNAELISNLDAGPTPETMMAAMKA